MPELVWTKWFPQDWLSDPCLSRCSPAARGIWKDIIDAILLSKIPELSGSTAELARICRCSESEFLAAISELKRHEVGHFNGTDGQHKIYCRRIRREFDIRELRRKAGKASATKRQHDPQHDVGTQVPTRSASASASASSYSLEEGDARGSEKPHVTAESLMNLDAMVSAVMTARPEFARLSRQSVIAAVLSCHESVRAKVIADFCDNAANMIECPASPLGLLKGYIRKGCAGITVSTDWDELRARMKREGELKQ